jgi:hypothetical protein
MRSRIVAALVIALAVLAGGCSTDSGTPGSRPASARPATPVAELDGRSSPPWPAPTDVTRRVADAGLSLGPMGVAEHYHPHLRIVVDGRDVQVPGNIGVDPASGAMSALHTHEPDGTVHIEAHTVGQVFTLGQLFVQWGVQLTPTQIGGVHATDGRRLIVTSNGVAVTGDPMEIRFQPEQRIELRLS